MVSMMDFTNPTNTKTWASFYYTLPMTIMNEKDELIL
jgi:hypothetical protein